MSFKLRFIAGFLVVTFLSILIAGCGGDDSGSVIAVPAAPTNLVATAGNGQVSLTWTPVTGAISYNVYSATTPGVTPGPTTLVGTSLTASATISPLANGTIRYFVVTAVNVGGKSPKSNEASATPSPAVPVAPTNLVATPGIGQVSLTWTAVTGATSYNVYSATIPTVTPGPITLVGTSLTNSATISPLTSGTLHYFVVTAVNASGESLKSNEVSATPLAAVFAQADLTGTWNIINFRTGPGVTAGTAQGWQIVNVTIAATGAITINTYLDNFGTTTIPAGGWNWAITPGASGLITETGALAFGSPDLVLASNKRIVTGTSSFGADRLIRVAVKQVGISFSNTDLTGPAGFNFNELHSGSDSTWAYGAGTIDASRLATVTSLTTPTGAGTVPTPTTLSVNATGLVTSSTNATFHGVMTPDKKVIFAVETNGSVFAFRVIQITGQTFVLSDLAGTWFSHKLVSSSIAPLWEHSTKTITALGVMTTTNLLDSNGITVPGPNVTLAITPAGAISVAADATTHGFMSFNKDLAVITATVAGQFNLNIFAK